MLVGGEALALCLRDAGVRADRSTLVQVGAHLAEEHDIWMSLGIGRIVYVEAIPALVAQLTLRFVDDPRVTVIEAVVSSTTGETSRFHINEPTYTSSLLDLEPITLERFPEIEQGEMVNVTTTCLSDLLDRFGVAPNVLVIDVQGAERDVLEGLGPRWADVQVLMVEYQRQPLYRGSPTMGDLSAAAAEHGLCLATAQDDTTGLWGDAVYVRSAAPRRGGAVLRRRKRCDLLAVPHRNAHSQFGEDGILREAFRLLGVSAGVLVEVGAWDGVYLSNCRALMEAGWRGYLVEGDEQKVAELRASCESVPGAVAIAARVGPAFERLSSVLDRAGCPDRIDLLSIDIDSDDLAVLEDVARSRTATVVCIEYNPTIPPDLHVRNAPGGATGNSFSLIAQTASDLGYDLVAWTKVNQVFVHRGASRHFVIHPWRLPAAPIGHARLFWGYDGTLYDVCVEPSDASHVRLAVENVRPLWGQGTFPQVVPPALRVYPPLATRAVVSSLE